jgi:DNA replication protein DnaC
MFLKNYVQFAKDAIGSHQSYENYLKALTEEELINRDKNRIKKLISKANFPFLKYLSEFKFAEIPKLNTQEIYKLSECNYIDSSCYIFRHRGL